MANNFWELAPPGYKLLSDIEKKKRKLLPPWLDPDEPDFVEEEQAGLTALAERTPFPGVQSFRAGAGPPGAPSPFRMPTPQEATTPIPPQEGLSPLGSLMSKSIQKAVTSPTAKFVTEEFPFAAGMAGGVTQGFGVGGKALKVAGKGGIKLPEGMGKGITPKYIPSPLSQGDINSGWQKTNRGRMIYKSDLPIENAKEEFVANAIENTPSYRNLLSVYKRFEKRLHSPGDPYVAEKIAEIEAQPWGLLTAHSGVMDAKSSTAQTLRRLADNVFKEAKLPRKQQGEFRGEDALDWDKVVIPEAAKPLPGQAPLAQAGKEVKGKEEVLTPYRDIIKQISELKKEMKDRGVRKISPFNAGLTRDEMSYNTRLSMLESSLTKTPKDTSLPKQPIAGKEVKQPWGERRGLGGGDVPDIGSSESPVKSPYGLNAYRKNGFWWSEGYSTSGSGKMEWNRVTDPKMQAEFDSLYPDLAAKAKPAESLAPKTAYQKFIAEGGKESEWEAYRQSKSIQIKQEGKSRLVNQWQSGEELSGNDVVNLLRDKGVKLPPNIIKALDDNDTVVSLTSASGRGMGRAEAKAIHKIVSEEMGKLSPAKAKPTETLAPKTAAKGAIPTPEIGESISETTGIRYSPDQVEVLNEWGEYAKKADTFEEFEHSTFFAEPRLVVPLRRINNKYSGREGLRLFFDDVKAKQSIVSTPEPIPPTKVAQGEAAIPPPKVTTPLEQVTQGPPAAAPQPGAGAVPPIEPPSKPPVVTGRPDLDDRYQKVAGWLRAPERIDVRNELDKAWKAEKGRRFAKYQELNQSYLNEGATPQEAQRLAKSAMKGKYGDPDGVMSDDISNIFAEVLFERNNIVNANDAGLHLSTAEAIRNALHRPIHYASGVTEKGKVELSALDKLLRLVDDVPELKEFVTATAKSGKSLDHKIQEQLIGTGNLRPWQDFDVPPSRPHAQYTFGEKEPSFIKKEQAKAIQELSIGEKANIEKMVSSHPLAPGEKGKYPIGTMSELAAEQRASEKATYDRYLATIKPAPQMTPEDIAAAKKALGEWQEETRKLNTIIGQEELLPAKPMDVWLKENPGATKAGYYDSIKEQWAKVAEDNAVRLRQQQDALDKASQYLKDLSDDTVKQLDFLPPDPNNPMWKRVLKEVGLTARDVGNLMRGFKAFLDNSWPNQQRLLLFKSAKADWLSMRDSLIALKNPTEGLRLLDEMSLSPEKAMHDKLGLDFYRPIKLPKWQKGYEGIEEFGFTQSNRPIARFTEKIPLMQRSQIAFAVGTNRNNLEIFGQYIAKVNRINEEIALGKRKLKPGEAFDSMKAIKDLGTMIEHMTGRAQLGSLKVLSPALNNGFFAIRNTLGRGLLVKDLLNPNPIARKEAWKLFASMAGSINAVALGGAKMGLWSYDTDPRSATTGQIRIGNSYYNPWGPWSSMLKLIARIATEEGVSAQGNVYKIKPWEEIGRYTRGKESPMASLITDILTKSTYLGEKPNWLSVSQWADRLAPMVTINAYDAFSIEEPTQASINTVLSFFGMYTQTYLTDAEKQQAIGEKAGIVKGRAWEEVTASEKTAIRNLPESRAALETKADSEFKRAEVARGQNYDQSLKNDASLIAFWSGKTPTEGAMSPKDWRNKMNEATANSVAISDWRNKMEKFPEKKLDPASGEAALDKYYQYLNLIYDPEKNYPPDVISDKIDNFMAKMSPIQYEFVKKNLHANATPLKKKYYEDKETLKPWFELRNKHEKKFRTDGYQQVQEDMQAAKRTGDRVTQAKLAPLYGLSKREEAKFKQQKELLLIQNARIDELLIKWGYRTEATNQSVMIKQRDGILARQFSLELSGTIR